MIALAQAAAPDEVRRVVEEVLSRPEYREAGTGDSVLDLALEEVLEFIGQLLARLGGADGGVGSALGAVGLLLLVVALVALAARAIARLRRSSVLDPVVDGQTGRPPTDWDADARRHEDAGELVMALRCRYRETVALLAEGGFVAEVPGRTTGEYAAATEAALPDAREPFQRLTAAFERAWYGGRQVTAEQYQAAVTARDEVLVAGRLRRRAARAPATTGGGSP